jgi:hippurate hydrolase
LIGVGGHAARPHAARNPIITGALIVQAIQSYVTQKTRPDEPIVATVGAFEGGTAANVIPEHAVLRISLRALSVAGIEQIYADLVALIQSMAGAYGLSTSFEPGPLMIPTVSRAEDNELVRDVIHTQFGSTRYRELVLPEMVAEDFSHFLEATGGAFAFLGAAVPGADVGDIAGNHSPRARFDDGILYDAAVFLAELALRRLRYESESQSR